jgi:sugar phosphate isomerase/epimerase
MLGISTSWWEGKDRAGGAILGEALEMGLEGVELDYRITPRTLEEMRSLLKRSCPVLSLHNVFPVPLELKQKEISAEPFLLSSTDREERGLAVKYAIRTIEHAHELEARAVVLHLGRVHMEDPTPRLRALFAEGKVRDEESQAFLQDQRAVRAAKSQPNLDAVLFSVERLSREAERWSVLLGIENRFHFHEIPNLDEIAIILDTFRGAPVRYWHDVGHAAVQENMGILPQRALLDRFSAHLAGIHLHDVDGLRDHLAPGQGEVDWGALRSFLGSDVLRILELRPEVGRESIREGMEILRSRRRG